MVYNKINLIDTDMERPTQPENKFYLSNSSIYEKDIEKSLEFFNQGSWTINSIETGKPIRSLSLGDVVEYVDPELSFFYHPTDELPPQFTRIAVGKVIDIKENEVLLLKENKERYMMGNSSKFVNYDSTFKYKNIINTEEKIGKKLPDLLILSALILSLFLLIIFIIIKIH